MGFPLDATQKEVQEILYKEAGGPIEKVTDKTTIDSSCLTLIDPSSSTRDRQEISL